MSQDLSEFHVPWRIDFPGFLGLLDGPMPTKFWLDWMQERSDNWPPLMQNAIDAGKNAASPPAPMTPVSIPANLVERQPSVATLKAIQAGRRAAGLTPQA